MTAESMMFNGAVVLMVLVLFGLAWGFLILKVQGGEAE
ncbi:PetM family cytochrome b6-f complex subunit 7 [Crocosphaera sp.]|nr:PetM family cytochrome b6-f complex subunit 7 [Crocosphaera sp.]MDJ0581277.1 PetM family cytochrome b6-f complex subunit 7 [Crocosphaera sp.]